MKSVGVQLSVQLELSQLPAIAWGGRPISKFIQKFVCKLLAHQRISLSKEHTIYLETENTFFRFADEQFEINFRSIISNDRTIIDSCLD